MPLQETSGAASYDAFGGGPAGPFNYIEDVFSTWLYTGNGSTQTITNGIDLSGKGGLVWLKSRSSSVRYHVLFDTQRGPLKELITSQTFAEATQANSVTSFNSNGFSLGSYADGNESSGAFVSWTFRKAPKFFDVVTWTGTGSNTTISHNLGAVPGCIIVKRTDTTADWQVYHRSNANTEYMVLNSTAAKATGTTRWNSTTPTSTVFSIGTDTTVNASGGTYVAYLFAHDAGGFGASGTDNVISCGSFTSDSSGNATVTLGYEPQWILFKRTNTTDAWYLIDNMRGFSVSPASNPYLNPNTSSAEATSSGLSPNATGFSISGFGTSSTFIYIAIRRGPMRTPTTGTSVFQPTVYTGTNVDNRLVNTTIAPDMVWVRQRNDTVLTGMVVGDRLRSQPYLLTGGTAAEVDDADAFDQQLVSAVEYGTAFSAMNGFWCGNDATAKLNANTTSNNHIAEAFKRAPGFFDVVCLNSTTSSAQVISHNLGVAPEIIISKRRNGTSPWQTMDATNYLRLNTNQADLGVPTYHTFTATTFSIDAGACSAGENWVFYLFATVPGVSKVGTYTGNGGTVNNNGTSQTINCGFSTGARFVLIKRTDSTGDWYVFDSARGIVASNDPYLLLNSTAAEVTTVDAVDADNSGFIVNQTSGTDLNVTSATYIYLAIA